MDKTTLASLKEKSREERAQFFNGSIVELMDELLNAVNGGADEFPEEYRNPDSDVPDRFGNWVSSWNFVCRGREICK